MNYIIDTKVLDYLPIGILILNHRGDVVYSSKHLDDYIDKYNIAIREVIQSLKSLPINKNQIAINEMLFLVTRFKITNNSFQYNMYILEDITCFQNVLIELRETKEMMNRFGAAIEASYDGIFIADEKGNAVYVNNAYEKLIASKREEILHKHITELTEMGLFSDAITEMVLNKKETITDIIKSKKTGTELVVTGNPVFQENGTITNVVLNLRDITELASLQRQLQKARLLNSKYYIELSRLRLAAEKIIFNSRKMTFALEMALRVAQFDSTILIQGESGVGKELFAELIHNHSHRKEKPLVKINCGSIPENLLESELFGYEGGAFSGAKKEGKPGLFEVADGGTILLDEIGELPLSLQVKLLRVLQESEMRRVGGTKLIQVNVRIIAVTNKNLLKMVKEKLFREDLYYRLNVVPITIPSLRDRKEDIPLLSSYFLNKYCDKYNVENKISPQVIDYLVNHNWPGNVRELENIIERLVVTSPNQLITLEDLPEYIIAGDNRTGEQVIINNILPLRDAVMLLEKKLVLKAISLYKTKSKAAAVLGVDRTTVLRKMNKYDIKS